MTVRIQEVVIDCADPAGLAAFWGTILDSRWGALDEGWAVVDAEPVLLAFQKVPEPKQSPKNRLHLDLQVSDWSAAVELAESLGARRTGNSEFRDDANGYVVMQDPEGNEFCFVMDSAGMYDRALGSLFAPAP